VDFFAMIALIVFMSLLTGTIHKYLEVRVRLAEARGSGGDRNLVRAIQELREEIAALRQNETEAVLSFDSTLHNLDARMKHLEHYTLGEGLVDRAALAARSPRPIEEHAA
jgi:hypothetical protein